jgi:membrane fusion protein, multidrug efflux system
MPRHRVAALLALLAGIVAAGCRGKPPAPAPPPSKVTVARPATAPVRDYYEYNGYLDTTETVEVRARVKGILTKILFTEGTEVTKDAPLYEIDDREYRATEKKALADLEKSKADVKNWVAQIALAEADLKRVTDQLNKGVGIPADKDKAVATLDVNKAQKTAAEAAQDAAAAALETARLQLGYTKIYAEIGGRISQTRVTKGNLVGQTEPTLLTTIVRVDELYVFFDAPEPDLVAYQRLIASTPQPHPTSQKIDVEVRVATEEGYPHAGKIDFRENRVETATGTVRIRGRIPNPPGVTGQRILYPGLYARTRVPGGDPKPQLVIPEDALMTGQEGRFVYVVKPDNTVEKRLVTLGPSVWKAPPPQPGVVPDGWVLVNPHPPPPSDGTPPAPVRRPVPSVVAITAGLQPDDRVIVEGLQRARPSAPVEPEEWVLNPPAPAK